ncbi:ATP-binding protein [Massilia sp. LXY-6]|uniref:ATP-binding response regulator n=1 Tax=Massilia sp. LXY-6 TaxID=3379823 RepID=UPI003EE34150
MLIRPTSSFATRVAPYLLALIGVLAAAAVRFQMGPVVGGTIPVVIFTVPVILVALYGGFAPGIFATLCSALISDYLFIEPVQQLGLETPASMVVMSSFLVIGVTISYFGHRVKALQVRLAEQAGKLAEANRELEEGSRRKDEFLAMLAHELRNPLAGISTAAELLKLGRGTQERVAQTGEVIGRQVRHMTKLVDDLLDVSRVTRGLVMIDKKPVDLKEALHGAIEQVRTSIASKRQALDVRLPDGEVYVCGDRIRLTQVISNLVGNASKYSPEGRAIDIELRVLPARVELEVADEGQGIEAGLLPHVFDLFVQAERTPDRSQGGLGIGLALVKRIVELHGGSVAVHSGGRGCGSRFTIGLPRLEQSRSSEGPAAAMPAVRPAPPAMRILVVDDNRDAADTVALLLDAAGHTVFVEYDAKAALARAAAERLDAVILDIGLPEQDGRELCRILKASAHLADAVFIALSGYGQEQDLQRSREAGFDRHLVKPVDIGELMQALAARPPGMRARRQGAF